MMLPRACRTAICACLLLPLLLPACAAPDASRRVQETARLGEAIPNADAQLANLARAEASGATLAPIDAPVPPGVDADLLRVPAEALPRASVAEVLAELEPFEFEPPAEMTRPTPPADPARQERALRHYLRGRQAAVDGDYFEAATQLEQAYALDPASPSVLRQLARAYLAQNNGIKAADRFARLLAIEPSDGEALLMLALGTVERRDFNLALRMLAPLVTRSPMELGDPGAAVLVRHAVWRCLEALNHDAASIEMGQAVIGGLDQLTPDTRFTNQLSMIYRQRAEIWRAIGDARCRLGNYEQARGAYERAAELPSADPGTLPPRLIYVAFRLGRVHQAQEILLRHLKADPARVSDREVTLTEYVARHSSTTTALAHAVRNMLREYPESAGMVRAAAVLMPPGDAEIILRDFVRRQPDNLSVVGQTLRWLGERDLDGAVRFITGLVDLQPTLADQYVKLLVSALPRPGDALTALERQPLSRSRDGVLARLYMELGGFGEAWQVTEAARHARPMESDPLLMQLKLTAALQEWAMLDGILQQARTIDSAEARVLRSQALRAAARNEEALEAAREATRIDVLSVAALIELARCHAAVAGTLGTAEGQHETAQRIAEIAEQALELEPGNEEAFAILAELFGPTGQLRDRAAFADVARRLHRANPEGRLFALLAAKEALGQQRWSVAIERLLPLYESDPSDAESLALLISAWLRQGRAADAEANVASWLEQRPGDPNLIEAWVQLLGVQGRQEEAVAYLRRRYEAEPTNPAVRNLLESALRQSGDVQAAMPLGEARLLGRPAGARGELELAALYAGSGQIAEAMPRLRWLADHIDQATLEHTASVLTLLQRIEPKDEVDLSAMSLRVAKTAIARFPEAPLQVYGAALLIHARYAATWEELDAMAHQAAARSEGARGSDLRSVNAWRGLAQMLVDGQHPAVAARAMRARLRTEPAPSGQVTALYLNILFATEAAARESGDRTIALLSEFDRQGALPPALGVSLADVLYQASLIYALVGSDEATEQLLLEAIRLDPLNSVALNNLGFMRIEANLSDAETIGYIERAHRLDPRQSYVLDTVGWLRYKQGRLQATTAGPGAIELIEESIERTDDPSAELYEHLGDARWRQGNTAAAVEAWREALRRLENPQHRELVTRNYRALQTQQWGVLVADPGALYDRDFGQRLKAIKRRIDAVEAGEEPPVAAQFTEVEAAAMSD